MLPDVVGRNPYQPFQRADALAQGIRVAGIIAVDATVFVARLAAAAALQLRSEKAVRFARIARKRLDVLANEAGQRARGDDAGRAPGAKGLSSS
ncbi:MAG: hypothetical protein WDM81_09380 [Rhizomicrobium sp.]